MTDKISKQEIEVYAIQVAQPDFDIMEDGEPSQRMFRLLGHLTLEDVERIVQRSVEISREIAEAALDEADRLNEKVRIAKFGPDRPDDGH